MRKLKYHKDRDNVLLHPMITKIYAEHIKNLPKEIIGLKLDKILDLGCAKGTFVKSCLDIGLNAYGIDLRDMYEGDRDYFIQGDIKEMPFPDEDFDVIFNHMFFEDLWDLQKIDTEEEISITKEIHRVLKKHGIIFNLHSYFPYDNIPDGFSLIKEYSRSPPETIYQKIN